MEMTQEQREAYYQALTKHVNESRGYPKLSNIRVLKIEPNYCEGELSITPDVCNYLGIVHGGCLAALAGTVAGVAACSTGTGTVTLSYGFNFLRPATGDKIRCVARPEKVGKQITVFCCTLTNDEGKTVASGQFTFFMTGPMKLQAESQDQKTQNST